MYPPAQQPQRFPQQDRHSQMACDAHRPATPQPTLKASQQVLVNPQGTKGEMRHLGGRRMLAYRSGWISARHSGKYSRRQRIGFYGYLLLYVSLFCPKPYAHLQPLGQATLHGGDRHLVPSRSLSPGTEDLAVIIAHYAHELTSLRGIANWDGVLFRCWPLRSKLGTI